MLILTHLLALCLRKVTCVTVYGKDATCFLYYGILYTYWALKFYQISYNIEIYVYTTL